MPQALSGSYERGREVIQVGTADIAQLDPFEIIPDALVGVEIGCVPRQLFQVPTFGGSAAAETL